MVSKLKDKAKRRKGRGFTGGRGEDRDEVIPSLSIMSSRVETDL